MDWFQNKKKKSPDQAEENASGLTFESNMGLRGKLDGIMAGGPASKGVVMKLYLENFKHLNKIFGYDYCEELLGQITSYLNDMANGSVYRHIGVEFIIILEQFSEGRAAELGEEILERFDHVWTIGGIDCLCSAQIGEMCIRDRIWIRPPKMLAERGSVSSCQTNMRSSFKVCTGRSRMLEIGV